MSATQILAIDVENAGAIVYWRLHGPVDHMTLSQLWQLDSKLLPPLPSPEVALGRAAKELAGKHTLVRALEAPAKGWAVVTEEASTGGGTLYYEHGYSVSLSPGKEVLVEGVSSTTTQGYLVEAMRQQLEARYQHHRGSIDPVDISPWLSKMADRCYAVTLRDQGGIYYIPPGPHLTQWRQVTGALKAASQHRLFEIPALESDAAVEAVLDAVKRDAEKTIGDMQAELSAGSLGARALTTRQARADEVERKLSVYEQLLGTSLSTFHEQLSQLRAGLSEALLSLGETARPGSSLADAVKGMF